MQSILAKTRTLLATTLCAGAALAASATAHGATVGWVELEGGFSERPSGLGWLTGEREATLLDAVRMFEELAQREDLDAVMIRLDRPALGATQIEEIGAAIEKIRDAGKRVFVFTEIYDPGQLMLASYADEALMQTGGAVSFPGVYMEEMFLADMLNWVGVQPSFVQIGDYKGAEEQFANAEPSEAWDQNITQLLDSMYATMRAHVRDGRNMSEAELDAAMEEAWMLDGPRAVELGLIDREVDRLDIHDYLAEALGEEVEYDTSITPVDAGPGIDMANPFAMLQVLASPPAHKPRRDTIAVIHIDGAIVDGPSTPPSAFGAGSGGATTIRKALRELEQDSRIKGVIVRVNSPGGSAIASENIWQGVRRVAETKPVWVSVGDMAASGGYYIAVSGDRIYMNPSSIVGSIGVVGGKFALGGVYETLKINVVPRARGPRADIFDTLTPWDSAERSLIRDRMVDTYDLFVRRVKAGREGIDIGKTAEGRLFTAEKAVALAMADAVGGLAVVVDDLAEELELTGGAFDVMHYPAPPTLEEFLDQAFGSFLAAPRVEGGGLVGDALGAIRLAVGEKAWPQIWSNLRAMMLMRDEPVLLVSPRVLIFR
ncbi:MAG: S49 family peptidase [Phycisphaerales bacterium]